MRISKTLIAVLGLALSAIPARADLSTWTASTAPGHDSADGPLSAQAIFTTSNGQITITLSNELAASVFRSPGQAVSDLSFSLSNSLGTLGAFGAAGQFGDISHDKNTLGLVKYVSTDDSTGNSTPVRWFANGSLDPSAGFIKLETIGGGQPSQMIAPTIADGGTYTNANKGLANFNSFVIGPATFTIAFSGITADTTVSSVSFSFGTSPDYFLDGTKLPQPIPEPSTLVIAGLGVLGFLSYGMRRRSTN